MKANEFSAMNPEQLTAKVKELKSELFNLRFQLATGQLQNTVQITAVKRDHCHGPRPFFASRSRRKQILLKGGSRFNV